MCVYSRLSPINCFFIAGIDVDEVRCEEEKVMLDDAKKMLNNPHMEPVVSSGGATPIHVAAAKNYTTVLKYVVIVKIVYK